MITQPSKAVIIACIVWMVFTVLVFLRLPFRKALLTSLIIGWMFLPVFLMILPGFPDLDRSNFICIFLVVMSALYEMRGKISRPKFHLRMFDFVVMFYCLIYILSAYLNNLGLYEGFSEVLNRTLTIGIPYLIGRLYFSDINSHKSLAISYVNLSFLYIPLALFEFRFSPQLHNTIYGYHQHSFIQTIREGVWRPVVFMRHGLEVALWLSLATIIGCWLVRSQIINRGFNLIALATLGIVTIIGQSWGAIILMITSLITLVSCHFFKMGLPFILLFIFPSVYIANRITNTKLEKNVIETARQFLPLRRFRSLTYRIDQEYRLIDRANQKMISGWGRFGRARVIDSDGQDRSITDSRWIIEYGTGGLLSLIPFLLIFAYPVIGLYKVAPASLWHTKNFAPSAALAVGTAAILNDLMLNSFCSLIHFLIVGALSYPYIENYRIAVGRVETTNENSSK